MKIKATEMEKIFGMSQNGIRLYEKSGILRLARREGNGYRAYGEEEMLAMGSGIQLRRYGFSMQEASALFNGTEEAQLGALEARKESLEQELERLMRMRKSLRVHTARIRQAERLMDSCALEEKPAMYFLGTLRGGRAEGEDMTQGLAQWVERYSPHMSAAILLDGPYLTDARYREPPLQGVAVDADVALELGLQANSRVLYLQPKTCVVTAVRFAAGDSLEPVFERVCRFARENGHQLYAGGLIRQVMCVRRAGKNVQTGLLYAPLAGEKQQFGGMR